jgi:hypothetical protein
LALHAQRIRVAVSIQDTLADRVFQGAFAAAFRSLGDVDVVTLAEQPQYVLSGVVLCDPSSCKNVLSYTAALRFWSPLGPSTARYIAMTAIPSTPQSTFAARADSVGTLVIWPMLRGFEVTHETWVASWGRDRYEQAVRELVRQIDTDCLEQSRAWSRATAAGTDTASSAAIVRTITARKWLC